MPIDEQGLGWPKVGDKILDRQGAGCQEHPAQSEDTGRTANLKTHKQMFQQDLHGSIDLHRPHISNLPLHCKEQSDPHPAPSTLTDSFEGRSILARICSVDGAEMYTDFQELDLMDY